MPCSGISAKVQNSLTRPLLLESLKDSRRFWSPHPVLRSTTGCLLNSLRNNDESEIELTMQNRYQR